MAVAAGVLSETQRRTLEAVCDTFAPPVEVDTDDAVKREFFARAASELGVAAQIEGLMADAMNPEQIAGFAELLDGLGQHDFANLPLEVRTKVLLDTAASSPEANIGVKQLRNLTYLFFYGLPDERGQNPNWPAMGYPGPISPPPSPEDAPKTIPIEEVGGERASLTADVCVVGSGAGGGVIAGELAQAGRSVVVLEMGEYRSESDFNQLELPGYFDLFLGGGLMASENGTMSILAGKTLGGGTTINWMNSLRTPVHILKEWAREHGLEGLDEQPYQDHFEKVLERISVNTEATRQNRPHQKLIAGMEACGLEHMPIARNVDPDCDDPAICGYCSFGCQRGCKQGTMRTYLQDAADAGARFVVSCRAERVLVDDGRARGVEATVTHADGSSTALTVEAPTVVVAGGSVESPALLLRSGIGGPAVGKHLRLHPALVVLGIYEEEINGWEGQIQSEISHDFASLEDGCGFLVESSITAPALSTMGYPWESGQRHKEEAARYFRHQAPFISVARDHGEGEVAIDDYGQPVIRWGLDDEVDRRLAVRAMCELAKLHRAAGAREIFTLHAKRTLWREGEDFDTFLGRIQEGSLEPNDITVFSAHQMGACRMGRDRDDYVADGRGELHDVKGVWIGDASAFPSAPGVNPMISIMALARRTAGEIGRAMTTSGS